MAIEDELVSCETCSGQGMTRGEVCPDCRGRGIVRVSHAIVDLPEDEDEEEPPKPLENLSKVQLVELATSMNLDATGKRDDLIERIKAGPLEPPAEAQETTVTLSKLKLGELQEIAEQLGLDTAGTRADLIERIEAAGDVTVTEATTIEVETTEDAGEAAPVDPEANAVPAPDGPPAEPADALTGDDADSPEDDLDDLNVAQLRERLEEAGLDTKGVRADLLERLRVG